MGHLINFDGLLVLAISNSGGGGSGVTSPLFALVSPVTGGASADSSGVYELRRVEQQQQQPINELPRVPQ